MFKGWPVARPGLDWVASELQQGAGVMLYIPCCQNHERRRVLPGFREFCSHRSSCRYICICWKLIPTAASTTESLLVGHPPYSTLYSSLRGISVTSSFLPLSQFWNHILSFCHVYLSGSSASMYIRTGGPLSCAINPGTPSKSNKPSRTYTCSKMNIQDEYVALQGDRREESLKGLLFIYFIQWNRRYWTRRWLSSETLRHVV
jgi:hypothetical protein